MIKDFIESCIESTKDRIKNPFVSSYLITFLLFNWRVFLFLLFSNASIEEKIIVINNEYCVKEAILWPLAISMFYIVVVPYLNLAFDIILSFSNNKKENRLKSSSLSQLEHKKAEAKYEREIAEERAGTSEISELKNQIERLSTENEKLSKQNKESFDRYNEALKIKESSENKLSKALTEAEHKLKDIENESNKKANYNLPQYLVQLVLTKLTENEIMYFKRYATFKESTIGKSFTLDSSIMKRLSELGIIKKNETAYVLTDLGIQVYSYIKEKGI